MTFGSTSLRIRIQDNRRVVLPPPPPAHIHLVFIPLFVATPLPEWFLALHPSRSERFNLTSPYLGTTIHPHTHTLMCGKLLQRGYHRDTMKVHIHIYKSDHKPSFKKHKLKAYHVSLYQLVCPHPLFAPERIVTVLLIHSSVVATLSTWKHVHGCVISPVHGVRAL